MISRYLEVDALGIDAMHAEPFAVLDALKLASLALQSTHRPPLWRGFIEEGFDSGRDDLDSAISRDPVRNAG